MRLKLNRLALLLSIFLITISTISHPVISAAAQQTGAPFSLSVTIAPPKIPADGRTYRVVVVSLLDKSENPSVALNDVTVFLTSSVESVGTVSPMIVIKAGTSFSVANFTTTNTPGISVITASASGLQPFSTTIQTVTPSGFPTKLQVFPIPGTTLARPNSTGTLIIMIEDETGLPARAINDVQVTISSSNTAVASIPEKTVTIKKDDFIGISSYESSFITGTSFITVSASGFISGSGLISVVGPVPLKLNIQALPPQMTLSSLGELVVYLTDLDGRPARATSDITVNLASSNTTVVSVDKSVTIKRGSMYSIASYYTKSFQGSSVITASSPGLVSSFTSVKAYKSSLPTAISLYIAPNPVIADNTAYSAIVVSLQNKTGYPALTSSDTLVTLTSSSSAVGTVNQTVVIKAGTNFAIAEFKTTYLVGTTQITASAQNLVPAQASISTFGPIPTQISIKDVPVNLPADGGSYFALSIMLLDKNGSPAISPTDVPVQLASSRPDVVSVNSTVTIPAGQTYIIVPVKTTVSPGSSNITASATGYSPSSTIVTTVSPAPSRLALFVAPTQSIVPSYGPTFFLSVQLQDSAGNPARARVETSIFVVSSNITVLGGPVLVKIGIGNDFNSTLISVKQGSSGTLIASSPGLGSSSVQISVLAMPISVQISPTISKPFIYLNQSISFQLTITVEGVGINNATVIWSSSQGTMQPSNTTTDEFGSSFSTFTPTTIGGATIHATVISPIVGKVNASSGITIISPPLKPRPTLLSTLLPFIPLIVVIIVVAIIVLSFRRIISRRKRKEVEEEEIEEETETKKT